MNSCFFCDIDHEKIIFENEYMYAIFDDFPVSEGHMLIVSKAHRNDIFEFEEPYVKAMWDILKKCQKLILGKFHPDGFNIGVNNMPAAGQTITHMHMHLIPRYKDDVFNPAGGVRGVIPFKKEYM